MNSTAKKLIATGALGASVLAGSVALAATGVVGPAGAQTPTAESMLTQEGGRDQGWFHRFREHRREVRRQVAQLTADTIGISREQLRQELASGKSIAQVATDNGVDPSVVAEALVTDANARLDQAVADGKVDEERAAKVEARIPQAVDKLLGHVFDGRS